MEPVTQQVFCLPVVSCRYQPQISNAVLVEQTDSFLRYQCRYYFKLDGPDKVFCLNSGLWSRLPVCRREYRPSLSCALTAWLQT